MRYASIPRLRSSEFSEIAGPGLEPNLSMCRCFVARLGFVDMSICVAFQRGKALGLAGAMLIARVPVKSNILIS